jgi:predicted Zn-dependent protease
MPRRPVVAISLTGDVETGATAIVGPAVAETFEVEVASAPPLTAPAGAFDRARDQWLSTAFLDVLARAMQRDWERRLGVTGVDLYVPHGLAHCQRADCVMWFSNALAETDRKGTRLCPRHAAELRRFRLQRY